MAVVFAVFSCSPANRLVWVQQDAESYACLRQRGSATLWCGSLKLKEDAQEVTGQSHLPGQSFRDATAHTSFAVTGEPRNHQLQWMTLISLQTTSLGEIQMEPSLRWGALWVNEINGIIFRSETQRMLVFSPQQSFTCSWQHPIYCQTPLLCCW